MGRLFVRSAEFVTLLNLVPCINDYYDERGRRAKAETEVFNNRVKVILFLITVGVGALTMWEKCSSLTAKKAADTTKQAPDSSGRPDKGQHRPKYASLAHKRHVKPDSKPANSEGHLGSGESPVIRGGETRVEKPVTRVMGPIQVANAEDIEFKLLSAEGSVRAQTIRMTVILTNRAANRFIWSDVHSIIDANGNEYLITSFTNGASTYDSHVPLDTDVPRKCTYMFKGGPSVTMIKLFKFQYQHKMLDDPTAVEFRDVPVEWK